MNRVGTILILLCCALLLPPGCGGGGSGAGEINMTSFSTDIIPVPTKIVRATVRNKDGQMLVGALVNFSTDSGQLCEDVLVTLERNPNTQEFEQIVECIKGQSIETNNNGIADIYLMFINSPVATVTATVSETEQRNDIPWMDSIGEGSISASILVEAN